MLTISHPAQAVLDDDDCAIDDEAAQLLGAQAAVRIAEINLAYTDITSPIAGAIGAVTYTPGNVVSPSSQALATIVSQDPMRVAFTIPQRTAIELRNRYEGRGGTSAPPERMAPASVSLRRRRRRPRGDLPQPDSPTSPRVSPCRISNDTPSTAFTSPLWRRKMPE